MTKGELLNKLLKDAFEAGENYSNSGEFAYYAQTFDVWLNDNEKRIKQIF